MLNYLELQALAAVVSERGFEKAAGKLFLTQSAVSRRIQQLEASLGAPVLVRSKPPVATALGQKLLNHLQQVTQLEVALSDDIPAVNSSDHAPLKVTLATNADSLATWLAEALAIKTSNKPPTLCFDLTVVDQSVGLRKMRAGEVMACICDSQEPVNGGLSSYLGKLRYQVVASPDFIARHKITTPAQLANVPCLVFDHDDKLQHQFLQEICGKPPQLIQHCPSSEGFRQCALAGLGFGLLPVLQIEQDLRSGQLVDLCPGYTLDTPLYWHYWQTESPPLTALRTHAVTVGRQYLITT